MLDDLQGKTDESACEHLADKQSEPCPPNGTSCTRHCFDCIDNQKILHNGLPYKILNKTKQNRKRVLTGAVGFLMIIVAVIIHVVDPLERILAWQMSVTEGTVMYDFWRKPPVSVFLNVYMFNFTNPQEFLEGREKLRVKEVGPYVYRELLENSNVTFNANGTVTYRPHRELVFQRELSVGDPDEDVLTIINIPYLGATSMLGDASIFMNLGLRSITSYLDSQPFLNLTVSDILLGYDDPLISLGNTMLPSFLGFSRFGLLDRMYAEPEGGDVVSMEAGYNNGLDANVDPWIYSIFSLDTYNGSPGMEMWGYGEKMVTDPVTNATVPEETTCTTVRRAFEGIMFPRKMNENKTFTVYRRAFCRTFRAVYDYEGVGPGGHRALWYKLDDNALNPQDPQSACYCRPGNKVCLRGFSDVSPCYYGIPLVISMPHFYRADPSHLETIDGLSPSKEKHHSFLIVEPELGIPLNIRCRIQMNLMMKKTKVHPNVVPFHDLILPIMWIDFTVKDMPPNIETLMTLSLYVGPKAQTGLIAVLGVVGSILVLLALFRNQENKDEKYHGCRNSYCHS